MYTAIEKNDLVYFSDRLRGFNFYENGIQYRGEQLFQSYCLNKVKFTDQDIIIDCGANYGDLFLGLSNRMSNFEYYGFEPSPSEFACLSKNVRQQKLFNLGLSDKIGKINFYLSTASGDSSVIEPSHYTDCIEISTLTLDAFCESHDIKYIKLFKLEAEGWEPEILTGSKNSLKFCHYIAVDGGPERGIDASKTLPTLNSTLYDNGFELIDIEGAAYRALYRNTTINE